MCCDVCLLLYFVDFYNDLSVTASPKPSSKQPTDLSGTMTDVDTDDAPTLTVTAPTPPRHLSSAVAMTTNTETNMRGSDSCDTDALAADIDSEKSDENSAVTKNTRGQDDTVNKCTPGGATQKSASRLGIPGLSVGKSCNNNKASFAIFNMHVRFYLKLC